MNGDEIQGEKDIFFLPEKQCKHFTKERKAHSTSHCKTVKNTMHLHLHYLQVFSSMCAYAGKTPYNTYMCICIHIYTQYCAEVLVTYANCLNTFFSV